MSLLISDDPNLKKNKKITEKYILTFIVTVLIAIFINITSLVVD